METVGDCYVTVTGIPEFVPDHAEILCHTALGESRMRIWETYITEYFEIAGMMWESREVRDPRNGEPLLVGNITHFESFRIFRFESAYILDLLSPE